MPKVLVAGDANVDLIVPFPRFLNDRRTLVEYPNPCLAGGGTCANTAVALSRLGVRTGFAGTIGCDQYGAYIKKDFVHDGRYFYEPITKFTATEYVHSSSNIPHHTMNTQSVSSVSTLWV